MADTVTRPLLPRDLDQRKWHYWGINDIYSGPTGAGQWVPNVGDKVFDGFRDLIVKSVDSQTLISELIPLSNKSGGADEEDMLVSVGPGTQGEAFRLYIDNRTIPQVMSCDARLRLNGTKVRYVKVFKGTNVSDDGHVISAMYDSSGVKLSENIPTELVLMPNANNLGIQTMRQGYCADTINDNEVVTMVCYSAEGIPISRFTMIAVNTSFIRTVDSSKRYITNIELVSQYLDPNDKTLLVYPLNLVKQSDSMFVNVVYSDGTTDEKRLIDGNKIALNGINSYIASEVGQLTKLSLVYKLSEGEFAMGTSAPLPDRVLQKEYRLLTKESDNSYAVKIYVVPRWNAATTKWELEYWLYNLERNMLENITSYIEVGATSARFVGDNYTTPQELVVAFNMSNLGPSFAYHRHVQTFTISLLGSGANRQINSYWNIKYSNDLNYGAGLVAYVTTDAIPTEFRLDISNGHTTVTEWLRYMYSALSPLYLTKTEEKAPDPTHIRIRLGTTWVREIAIADVLKPLTGINTTIPQGHPVRIEYIRRTPDTDLELAMGVLTAKV